MCRCGNAHRIQRGVADQNGNRQKQYGCQNFTDTVHQFARRHRQPIRHAEKRHAERRQPDCFLAFIQKRRNGNLKRHRRRTRHGKQRPDGQIQRDGKRYAVPGRNPGCQRLHIARTGIADGNHAQQRQTRAGQQETCHRREPAFPRLLSEISRKNQIARTEKQSEQHQTDRPQRGFTVERGNTVHKFVPVCL